MIPVLEETLQHYLLLPTLEEWSNIKGNWNRIEIAVGAINERVMKYIDLLKIKNISIPVSMLPLYSYPGCDRHYWNSSVYRDRLFWSSKRCPIIHADAANWTTVAISC